MCVCCGVAPAFMCVPQIMKFAKGNKRFAAIDRAIAKDGFKVWLAGS